MKRILTLNAVASALYVYVSWRTFGLRGLACAPLLLCVVAGARFGEKELGRNAAFWLDMLYAAILASPFFLK